MKKPEIIKMLTLLAGAYNNFRYPKENEKETEFMEETWLFMLEEYDYPVVRAAVKKLIVTMPDFPPNVGQVIQEIDRLNNPDRILPEKAWSMALEVVQDYGTYNSKDAVDSLPPVVKKAVECMGGFDAIGRSEVGDSYFMNQFMKVYRSLLEEEKEKEMLPGKLKREIETLNRPQITGNEK
jgi:hypothetical protein